MDRPHGPSGLLTEAQELDLIRRAQEGDSKAEDALIRAFMPLIETTSKRMAKQAYKAGSRDTRREDFMSDAMAAALIAIRKYTPGLGCRLGSYIIQRSIWYVGEGGLTHEIISSYTPESPVEDENTDATSSSGINPERIVAGRALLASVMNEIDNLRGRGPDVVRWKTIDGLTYQQIGDRLGISMQRADQIYQHAMTELRERLGDKMADIVST